jgi:hypothetical protein
LNRNCLPFQNSSVLPVFSGTGTAWLWNIETIKEIYIIYADAVGMLKHRNGKFTLGKPPLLS